MFPVCKQSVDRLPLVTDENAKLAALKTQWIGSGAVMLTLPRSVMYCSHNVRACKANTDQVSDTSSL